MGKLSRMPFKDWSLLQRFGFISLVVMTLIGVFLGRMLRTSVETQVLAGTIGEAEVVARLGLQNAIGPDELQNGMQPDRVRAVQLALRSDFSRIDVADVVLWNLDGTVIFASDTNAIGTTTATRVELRQAAAGEPTVRVVDSGTAEDINPALRRHGTIIEVYQPVQFGSIGSGETVGVLRTSTPYAPIAETIAGETRRLYIALGLAFVLLYTMLFRLVAGASRELRRRADENEKQARHDALTGLPNRTLFAEEIDTRFKKGRDGALAIAILDLDRFKEVNDTLGHHHGDLLLVEVGQRLEGILRPNDVVARLGGDEFALLLADVPTGSAALKVAQRIVATIEVPYEVGDLRLVVGASLGVALSPQHGDDLMTLLRRADIACLLYTSPSPRDKRQSRMPSSA